MAAVLQALLAAVLFGLSTPVSKLLLREVDPIPLAACLYLGAGIGSWLLFVFQHPGSHGQNAGGAIIPGRPALARGRHSGWRGRCTDSALARSEPDTRLHCLLIAQLRGGCHRVDSRPGFQGGGGPAHPPGSRVDYAGQHPPIMDRRILGIGWAPWESWAPVSCGGWITTSPAKSLRRIPCKSWELKAWEPGVSRLSLQF